MRRARRWLRALLAPVLALCLLPLPAARAATAAELQAAAYSAYYDFLQAEISRIGIIGNCEQYFKDHLYDSIAAERPKGLLYAKLIDFDNSGVDELLIVKVDDDDPYGLGITDVRLQVYAYSGATASGSNVTHSRSCSTRTSISVRRSIRPPDAIPTPLTISLSPGINTTDTGTSWITRRPPIPIQT